MTLDEIRTLVARLGHPVLTGEPESAGRFPDGRRYRIEIPSCEGPAVMTAVLDEASTRGVPIDRVSQGSGIMMLTDNEIDAMVGLGREHDVEVCLFLGPRGAWDTGGQAKVSTAVGGAARGNAVVAASLADAVRACDLGVLSLLVGDLGVLELLGGMKTDGRLPADLVLKTSVLIPLGNGPTAALYERVGATSLNVSTDLTIPQLAEIRAATAAPIDMYVEVPDDQGGSVRMYDVVEVVRVAAPVYLKLGVRNAPNIYPVGAHVAHVAENLGRERVRRAELVLRLLAELAPELVDHPVPTFDPRRGDVMTAGPQLIPLRGVAPVVEPGAWLAPNAVLVGRVTVRAGASIWFGVVARAEHGTIEVGPDANIQDNSVLHTDAGLHLSVGRNSSVGHGVVLHGCTIGDDSVVGMGSRVLNGARVGSESLLAAGAVVLEGRESAPRSLLAGVPAKVRGELDEEKVEGLRENGRIYQRLRDQYQQALAWEDTP